MHREMLRLLICGMHSARSMLGRLRIGSTSVFGVFDYRDGMILALDSTRIFQPLSANSTSIGRRF